MNSLDNYVSGQTQPHLSDSLPFSELVDDQLRPIVRAVLSGDYRPGAPYVEVNSDGEGDTGDPSKQYKPEMGEGSDDAFRPLPDLGLEIVSDPAPSSGGSSPPLPGGFDIPWPVDIQNIPMMN